METAGKISARRSEKSWPAASTRSGESRLWVVMWIVVMVVPFSGHEWVASRRVRNSTVVWMALRGM